MHVEKRAPESGKGGKEELFKSRKASDRPLGISEARKKGRRKVPKKPFQGSASMV